MTYHRARPTPWKDGLCSYRLARWRAPPHLPNLTSVRRGVCNKCDDHAHFCTIFTCHSKTTERPSLPVRSHLQDKKFSPKHPLPTLPPPDPSSFVAVLSGALGLLLGGYTIVLHSGLPEPTRRFTCRVRHPNRPIGYRRKIHLIS